MLTLPNHFTPGFSPPNDHNVPPCWFVFSGDRLLVDKKDELIQIPTGFQQPLADYQPLRQLYMGTQQQTIHCYALEIERDIGGRLPPTLELMGLRELWGVLDEASIGLAGQAIQLVDWDRCHQFCGRCGEPMTLNVNDRSKRCSACSLHHYPRIAPAVMVRIVRGDEILLARSPRFVPGMYSVLAGFVDPGETIEQAAHREVMEEVGLTIKNLQYMTSQSWPFPHSLMIGFSADYAGGEIRLEDEEIEDAGWFTKDNLPKLPITMSIARYLINDFLASS